MIDPMCKHQVIGYCTQCAYEEGPADISKPELASLTRKLAARDRVVEAAREVCAESGHCCENCATCGSEKKDAKWDLIHESDCKYIEMRKALAALDATGETKP